MAWFGPSPGNPQTFLLSTHFYICKPAVNHYRRGVPSLNHGLETTIGYTEQTHPWCVTRSQDASNGRPLRSTTPPRFSARRWVGSYVQKSFFSPSFLARNLYSAVLLCMLLTLRRKTVGSHSILHAKNYLEILQGVQKPRKHALVDFWTPVSGSGVLRPFKVYVGSQSWQGLALINCMSDRARAWMRSSSW